MRYCKNKPPRLVTWLLLRLNRQTDRYSLLDDLEIEYGELANERSRVHASFWYMLHAIRALPELVFFLMYWRIAMLKNYFKIALRNLNRNTLYSMIGIFGLALAIGCFTLPFLVIDLNNSIDTFHDHLDEIFFVESIQGKKGGGELWGDTPIPFGPKLKQDYSQVVDYVRIRKDGATVRFEDKTFKESIYFVDESFLDLFTFPIVRGDKHGLSHMNGIIMTDRCADKYFSDENPIGKEIIIGNGNDFRELFVIKGVVENPPEISSLQFDILMPFKKFDEWANVDFNDWGSWAYTFIRLKNKDDVIVLKTQPMDHYMRLQNEANTDWPIQRFLFESFVDLSKHTDKVNNDPGQNGFPTGAIIALSLFGILLLMLASFNYINIGIVTATRRLKEVGIRKVMGSSRSNLIAQFIGEHVLVCFTAIILGALFAKTCVIPFFTGIFPAPLKLDFFHNIKLSIFYGITFIMTVLVSGSYPALYVSRFKPIDILNKTQKVGGGSKILNIFLIFQFVLTFLMLGTGLIFIQNTRFLKNVDWGYSQAQVINVPFEDGSQFEIYKNAILRNPNIKSIAGTQHQIGRSFANVIAEYRGEDFRVNGFSVGYDYLNTMLVRLRKGRTFDRDLPTDDRSIIINEQLVRIMGLENPIGRSVTIDNLAYTVIGVVDDFYYQPFDEPLKPAFFRLCEPKDFRYLSVRVRGGTLIQTAEFLEDTWKQLFPYNVYEGYYQDGIWDYYFRVNEGVYKISCFIGFIALVISCMGLFGLISVSIVKRIREISIRKILGSSLLEIIALLNRNNLKILSISLIISIPLCYFWMDWFLDFCYGVRTPLTMTPFIAATALIVCTSLLTVLSQIIKGAKTSIVDSLREE